jgi:polycomb protein EED
MDETSTGTTEENAMSIQDDEEQELVGRHPHFRMTGRNQQRHRKPLYSLAWCTDIHKGKSGTEYQYLAICGHNMVSIYEVQTDSPRGVFQVRQTYKDDDKEEQFYACEFAGRSRFLANAALRTNVPRAESYAANAEDTSSSRSDYDSDTDSSSSNDGNHGRKTDRNVQEDDTGEESTTLLLEKEHCVDTNYVNLSDESLARGPQLLCVAGVSKFIKVIDPVRKKQIATLRGHGHEIYDLKVSPTDENLLLSASVDESIRLWNLRAFACVAIFAGQHGHVEFILSLSWHASGERFASSGKDQSIRLWSIKDGKVPEAIQASNRLNPMQRRPSFRPASHQFPYFVTRKVHRNIVDCVHFLGDMILSKSTYNIIVLWMPVLPEGGATTSDVGATAYNPPGDVIALRTFELHDCNLWFVRFAVDPAGKLLAVGTIDGEVDIWDIDACKERPSQNLKAITKSTVRTLAFSPDGKILITCCDNAQVSKWNDW